MGVFAYGQFESKNSCGANLYNFGLVEKATEVAEKALLTKPDSFELLFARFYNN